MCTRCPKRFNRADLLTRHEITHDRSPSGPSLPSGEDASAGDKTSLVPGSDRAGKACLNCAVAKAKCEDRKPCSRCRARGVPCEVAQPRTPLNPASAGSSAGISANSTSSPVPEPARSLGHQVVGKDYAGQDPARPLFKVEESAQDIQLPGTSAGPQDVIMMDSSTSAAFPVAETFQNDLIHFTTSGQQLQDFDFSWDLNFDDLSLPNLQPSESTAISRSTGVFTATSSTSGKSSVTAHNHSRNYAAFKRSPWLWEPELRDSATNAKEGLALPADIATISSNSDSISGFAVRKPMITPLLRDKLFSMVVSQITNQQKVPSFPSVDLLNHLFHAHFVQDSRRPDCFIHAPSFDPSETLTELVAIIVASGATFISIPEIWRFGLALQEVVRTALGNRFERENLTTRELMAVQGYMLILDIGQESGFNRKMEIAEGFLSPTLTVRRPSSTTLPFNPSLTSPRCFDGRAE
jgi:hypothetical protein